MENQELNNNEVNNGAEQTAEQKPGVISKAIGGVKHVIVRAKATKTGRVVIAVAKGAVVGLGLYETYNYGFKKGQQSVTPTVVTITEGVQETEAPAEEPVAEEANEMEAEETI